QFAVNGKNIGSSPIPATIDNCFKFLWGANDYQKFKTRDIPPMRIRDIKIFEQGRLKYFWPLDETSGDLAYDKVGQRVGKIKNPVWIKPKYQKWEMINTFTLNGYAAVTYDPRHDNIYIAGSDSLAICSLKMDQHSTDYIPCRHQEFILGHQTLYDSFRNKLYDIFVDKKLVMTFDFERKQWDVAMPYSPITEYWHANKFITPVDSSLYMIGGYGQLRYKNRVVRYDFSGHGWDSIHVTGDYFSPRYLSGLGVSPDGKYAYVVGGYGSQTGDQMLDPRNYYDLYRYDIKGGSFKRMFTLKTQSTPFTFSNNLVIGPKPNAWYGLIYANDSYNSNLQLVEGSLTDSSYVAEGDAIPYSFHDVQSYADLYYSPISNKLIAVTMLYSKEETKEKVTQIKIYTLNFPPEKAEAAAVAPVTGGHFHYWYVIVPLLITGGGIYLAARRHKKAVYAGAAGASPVAGAEIPAGESFGGPAGAVEHIEKNIYPGVYLFGAFQVFDKEGSDITRLFTPLLKELFLIIATYTIRNGRGISSEGLNEILWHDKAEKDAKNNRSVNLAKLKAILEKVGNTVINKESGYWQFQTPEEDVYVDYRKYVSIVQGSPDAARTDIRPLVHIIKRGSFLAQTEYNWLDDIKSEVSNAVIDHCLGYIRNHPAGDAEFIIEIANCIFCFDPLNEDALTYKCKSLIQLRRHTLANNTYQKFLKEYKDIYGSDFGKSFQEVIA
ncbi:MAG TPA: kelch repeat-containing protein, partial [Puia sp.]